MEIGVVLGGGGIRGAAHIGVLKELGCHGIKPAAMAGTSSGGLVAALYAAGAALSELEHLALSLNFRSVVGSKLPLRRSHRPSLLNTVQEYLSQRSFESLSIPLSISAFDPVAGEIVMFNKGPVLPALYATIALPGFLPPAKTDDRPILVDGGLVSSLPTEALQKVDAIIAVDVSPSSLPMRRPHRFNKRQWIYEQAYIALHRLSTASDRARADIVLCPDVGDVSTFDFSQTKRCIDSGQSAVNTRIQEIQALLSKSTDRVHS